MCVRVRVHVCVRVPTVSFIYLWLCWVFTAAQVFSSCGDRGLLSSSRRQASFCGGFSRRAQPLGHAGFSRGSQALEPRLSSCGSRP